MAYENVVDFASIKAKSITKDTPVNTIIVEGHYLGFRTTPDNGYGPGVVHYFQKKDGTGVEGVFGKTNLNRLLTDSLKGICLRVKFTGMGEKQRGKNPAYCFLVQQDKDNTIDISNLDLAVTPSDGVEDEDSTYVETAADSYEDLEETELDADEEQSTRTLTSTRPTAPKTAAQAPSADRQAKVRDLLQRSKQRTG